MPCPTGLSDGGNAQASLLQTASEPEILCGLFIRVKMRRHSSKQFW